MIKILFVCTGNICRSPSAQAILEKRIFDRGLEGKIEVDSAGTHGYHVGEEPDHRAISEAHNRAIVFSNKKARQISFEDYRDFDYIFAMDLGHLMLLEQNKPENSKAEIALFLKYVDPHSQKQEVDDPYYGEDIQFSQMFDLLERGVDMLIDKLAIDNDIN